MLIRDAGSSALLRAAQIDARWLRRSVSLPRLPYPSQGAQDYGHDHHTHLSPLIALIVGILILISPRFLNYFVAIYLIVTGVIGLGALRYIGGP